MFVTLAPLQYRVVYHDEIKLVSFGGYDFKVRQIFHATDIQHRCMTGALVTSDIDANDLAKMTGAWTGALKIKALTPDKGLWELEMSNARLSQVDKSVIWFNAPAIATYQVLQKPQGRRR